MMAPDVVIAKQTPSSPGGILGHVFEMGMLISYKGRPHVVVGVTPMSVTPQVLELEDSQHGCIRCVKSTDADLHIGAPEYFFPA